MCRQRTVERALDCILRTALLQRLCTTVTDFKFLSLLFSAYFFLAATSTTLFRFTRLYSPILFDEWRMPTTGSSAGLDGDGSQVLGMRSVLKGVAAFGSSYQKHMLVLVLGYFSHIFN